MIFGENKQRIEQLELENANLRKWVEHYKSLESIQTPEHLARARAEIQAVAQQIALAKDELSATQRRIVETDEIALLQEVGIYRYRHPLDTVVAYQERLKTTKDAIAGLAKNGAIDASLGWTVNNSRTEGAKMTRDLSKLMLRAYNAEADNLVRSLRPHTLASAIARLDKSRATIAKLGTIVQMQITDTYHRWRIYELELTADYLVKVEEEKERSREERAQQRENERATRELEAERRRLEKEQAHYETAVEKLRAKGDLVAVAELEGTLLEIGAALTGIENREANIRAGYVYVISNFGSFGEHIVKIGMTRRLDPMDRVRELGDASVPFRFNVHALVFSHDAVGLENKLHAHFSDRRVNLVNYRREYFYVAPQEVREALGRYETEHLLEFELIPEANEWRQSGGARRAAELRAIDLGGGAPLT